MSNLSRIILKTDTNEVSPTGFLGKIDGPTMMRKVASLIERGAQGACAANMALALNPVAAQALITTTHTGDETASDTLTVGNIVITMEASSAAGASNQVNIASGTAGTSTSGSSPALTASGLSLSVSINGDGFQTVYIDDAGTHTGAQVAAKIQTAIRALTPFNALNAVAYSSATCTYGSTYVITAGVKGLSSVVVASVPGNAGAKNLKLGLNNGGTEAVGTFSTNNAIAALINGQTLAGGFTTSSTSFAGICTAFACGDKLTLTAAIGGTMGNGLAITVSSTGTKMVITSAFGVATAGTEGTNAVYSVGL
jgi:hypothetical protein